MKKIVLSVLAIGLGAGCLFGAQTNGWYVNGERITKNFPIEDPNLVSIDNGGKKTAVEAYSDGVGVFIVKGNFKNELNKLILKYGNDAAKNNLSVYDYILTGPGVAKASSEDIALAKKIKNDVSLSVNDGDACDDNNPNTFNDIYVAGICKGIDLNSLNTFFPSQNNKLPYKAIIEDGAGPTFNGGTFADMINNTGNKYWNYYGTQDSGNRFGIIDMGKMTYFDEVVFRPNSSRNFKTVDVYVGNSIDSLKLVKTVACVKNSSSADIKASGKIIKFHGHGSYATNQPAVKIELKYKLY